MKFLYFCLAAPAVLLALCLFMNTRKFQSLIEESVLPWVLLYRATTRHITFGLAWYLLHDTWWPFRKYRRWRSLARVKRDQKYDGNDEFHPSLNMDGLAMLDMTKEEQEEYLEDLVRRRNRAHYREIESREEKNG